MKSFWLNKQNNKNLIVFFTGWSFDYHPFQYLDCEKFDVLFIYDYNDLKIPQDLKELSKYENKNLKVFSLKPLHNFKRCVILYIVPNS